MKLSIIIPVFNEQETLEEILNRVENQKEILKQIIIVNDASSDSSKKIIKNFKFVSEFIYLEHEKNLGKGGCIKTAKEHITGNITLIQDADLEYDPSSYKNLIEPIINGKTNVVYGSRVLGKNRYKNENFISLFRIFANHLLTIFSNLINNQRLTDAHTCYKVISSKLFNKIELSHNDFSFCPELTTKLSNLNEKIIEVPVNYSGRTVEEGKKIKFIDAIIAVLTIIKFKLNK